MNQSQFLAITCNKLKARKKSRVHGAIGFGFAYHWLKNWRESFKPITKRSNRNHVIAFDSHLKTALLAFVEIRLLNVFFWERKAGFGKLMKNVQNAGFSRKKGGNAGSGPPFPDPV